MGSNIHLIIEEYYKSIPEMPSKKQIEITANDCLQRLIFPDIGTRNITKVTSMVKNFIIFEFKRLKISKTKNIPFTPEFSEVPVKSDHFHGIPDMIWNETIYDFKSNKKPIIWESHKIQGSIYHEILFFLKKKEYRIVWIFLRELDIKEIPAPSLPWLYEKKKHMDSCVEQNYYPPRFDFPCNWCDYKMRCDLEERNEKLWDILKWDKLINLSRLI